MFVLRYNIIVRKIGGRSPPSADDGNNNKAVGHAASFYIIITNIQIILFWKSGCYTFSRV